MKGLQAWGVDVTAAALRGVKLELGPDGQPRIVAWDIIDYTDSVDDVSAIGRFGHIGRGMTTFVQRHDLDYSLVWVSLRSETAFNRTVVVPPVNDESLDKILEYEAQQQVPFPLDEVYWDRRVLAIRESGEVLSTLYAIKKVIVEDRLRRMQSVGLPVDGLQLRPVALQNFCAFERLIESGTVVIDVDYNGLQVLVHHDDQTWFRVLPVGAVDFVNLVEKSFQCGHHRAVKIASGASRPPNATTFEACQRKVGQQLADEAAKTVNYYLAARRGAKARSVVLFESHPCVPPMSSALKKTLGLDVFRPKGFRHIAVDPDVVTAGIQENFPALAKAAGLALQGVGKAEVEVRLFSATLQRPQKRRRAGFVVAALLLLGLIAFISWRQRSAEQAIRKDLRDLNERSAAARTKAEMEQRIAPDQPLQLLKQLVQPASGQETILRIHEHVLRTHAEAPPEERPGIAAVRYEEAQKGGYAGTVVLVMSETAGTAELDAAMDKFASSLSDGKLVKSVVPKDAWSAGAPVAEPPHEVTSNPMRFRFRHRRYELALGGVAP